MRLTKFSVQMYKGIVDSGPIAVEALTVIVGKNEAGKTTLLKALHKLNPATPEPYILDREWPRGRRRDRSAEQVVCSAVFALEAPEAEALGKLTAQQGAVTEVTVTRDYAGRLEVVFPDELFPDRLHPNDVDRQCDELTPVPILRRQHCGVALSCVPQFPRIVFGTPTSSEVHDPRASHIPVDMTVQRGNAG